MTHCLHVVIIWILSHPPVKEGPSEVVNSVLFIFNGFGDNLCVEMIMETVIKMTLDGKRLVKELLEEVLLGGLTEKDALCISILRSSLQQILFR